MAATVKRITTDAQCKAIKVDAGQTSKKVSAGDGLYLLTKKAGKYWKWNYRFGEKHKTYSIGAYPAVGLKAAKASLAEAKAVLSAGIDPNQAKQDAKEARKQAAREAARKDANDENTLQKVGEDWFAVSRAKWADSHASKQHQRMVKHLYPKLGHIPVAALNRQVIADAMLLICNTSSPDIGNRLSQITRQILSYACNRGLIEFVPMGDMRGVLPPVTQKHLPCISENKRLGEYIRAIHNDDSGTYVVCAAMRLFMYVATRCGEFRAAQWQEIDFKGKVWVIPAKHRKLAKAKQEDEGNAHVIPLSHQALELLREIQQVTGNGKHIFPSVRGDSRPMSEAAMNTRIAALGFKGEMVSHSWRSVYSTHMNALGHNPDAIEGHLAHVGKDKVRAAYNRNDYMQQRAEMMQEYADWLDELRDS